MWTSVLLALSLGAHDSLTISQVEASYPAMFRLQFDSTSHGWVAHTEADTLPVNHPLGGFTRVYQQYLSYLAQQALVVDRPKDMSQPSGREALRRSFYGRFTSDTALRNAVLAPVARYLKRHGSRLADYDDPSPAFIPLFRATAVASRFFNPDVILPDGTLGVHICIVKHGMFDTLGPRNVALEAFAFAAVWDDVSGPDSLAIAMADFWQARAAIKALPLAGDRDQRVAVAQRTMWQAMERSAGLLRLLRARLNDWPDLPLQLAER